MKKTILTSVVALAAFSSLVAASTPMADGYYRVKNYKTNRYLYLYDNTGKINAAAGSADVGALDLWKNLDRAISDPGSILYARFCPDGQGGGAYDVEAQGTSLFRVIGHCVSMYRTPSGRLNIYASMGGFTKYLDDEETNLSLEQGMAGFNRSGDFRLWDDYAIDVTSDNYFGVAPSVASNGKYYQPFYASFPFSFYSEGMKAYYVKHYDAEANIAVIAQVNGNVPGGMPIIVECSSQAPTNNRLDLLRNNDVPYQDNLLSGVYFCNMYREDSPDAKTAYDAETMRVLGVNASGELAFTKYSQTYLPANQSYLVVPAGTPDVVDIMTEEEYDARVINVSSISLSAAEATVTEGDAFQLTAVVAPGNATDATLTWSSSANEIATVDETGLVSAIAPGIAVITATANDGSGVTASCTVTVEKKIVPVTSISFDITEQSLYEGESFAIYPTVTPHDATDITLSWSSSDETVAEVHDNGWVTAISEGTAVITATANDGSGAQATCTVYVEKNIVLVSEIILNVTEQTIEEGQSLQLTATVVPENATDCTVSWTSSDELLATVSETGLVEALAPGVVLITAKSADRNGVSATCTLTIEPSAGISSVTADVEPKGAIYTLSGILVRQAGESVADLTPGLYIIDGKKAIIK